MTIDALPVAGPATHLAPPHGERWTIADYEQLPDDGARYELIGESCVSRRRRSRSTRQ